MKKWIFICIMLLFCSPSFAETTIETSIAVKEGYINFANNGDSFYEGNTIMDNGLSGGYYFRIVKEKIIYRLDIDSFKTGNTFSQSIPIAYEKVDFYSRPIILSAGRYLNKGLYVLVGAGMLLNNMQVEQYDPYPFDYSIDNSESE